MTTLSVARGDRMQADISLHSLRQVDSGVTRFMLRERRRKAFGTMLLTDASLRQ
jgi:hypothetical protein